MSLFSFKSIKVRLRDRHAEHADQEELALCDHKDFKLYPGDNLVADLKLGGTVYAQVEMKLDADGNVDLILNQPDYVVERRVRKEVAERTEAKA